MRKRYAKLLGLACLIGAMGLLPSSQSRAAGWLKDGNYWYYMTDDGQKYISERNIIIWMNRPARW